MEGSAMLDLVVEYARSDGLCAGYRFAVPRITGGQVAIVVHFNPIYGGHFVKRDGLVNTG